MFIHRKEFLTRRGEARITTHRDTGRTEVPCSDRKDLP